MFFKIIQNMHRRNDNGVRKPLALFLVIFLCLFQPERMLCISRIFFAQVEQIRILKRQQAFSKTSYEKLGVLYAYAYIPVIQSLNTEEINMKIEQNEAGAIYNQNVGEEKIKSRRLLKEIFEKQSEFKFYGWDFCQNYTYITYLKYFKNIFESPQARKRAKVFTHISKLLNTRTSNQIKCHHQKMMNRHKSIAGIIEYLRLKIIKYLKHHSEAITEIEKINRQCENFFIRESGFQLRVQESLQHKKNKVIKRAKKQAKQDQGINVKQEDNMEHYEYRELKNSEFSNERLKIEEAESDQPQD